MKRKSLLFLLLLALLVPWAANAQTTVTIGDGTSSGYYTPIGTYYNYSITEQLYTAEEIGTAGTISSVSFYWAYTTAKDFNITMYMANVDAADLSTGISLAEADEVFSGTLSVPATAGWVTITLDTPFAYDGTSNLLIGFNKTGGSTWFSGNTWRYTSATGMARYTQQDGSAYTTSTVPGTVTANRPNIQIEITPGGSGPVCEKPETFEVSNVTTTTATLTWTGGSGNYNVEYKGGSVADWTAYLTNTTATTANLTGLTPGTAYQYRVQSVCGSDVSGWKNVSFQTMFGIPLNEAFGTSIPSGWSMYTGLLANGTATLEAASYGWNFGTNNGVFDSHARVNIYGTSCKYWLVTPAVLMENNVQLTFDLALTAYSGTLGAPATSGTDDRFTVLITTNGGETWTTLRQWDNAGSEYVYNNINSTATGEFVAIDLSSYAGQNIAIAFYGESTVSNADNNLHIDNVSIDYIPDCAKPTGLAVSDVTAHTATISWTSDATAWQIGYTATGGAERYVEVTENPYTLTDLIPQTVYQVRVQTNCGSGVYSIFTNPLSFTTAIACTAPTGLATSNLTGHGATITWTAEEGAWYQSALVKTAEYDANNITWSESFEGNSQTWNNLNPETGYTFALRKDCSGADDGYSTVVTRTFTTTVACPAPTVAVSNVTTTTADVTCTNTEATEFNVQLINPNVTPADTTTIANVEMPYTLTGLTMNSSYKVRVQALCGGDGESAWSSVVTFMTAEECPDGMVCIGTGTSTNTSLPAHNYYNYSLTEQIYTAAEIGMAGQISSIEFYKASTTAMNVNLDIYMVSTDKDEFTGTSDWIQVTAGDLVYSGTVTFTDNDWTTIELQNPFDYDGTSNLCIVVDNNTGDYESSTPFRVFTAAKNQALYQYNDNTNLDPTAASIGTASGRTTSKNRIRIAIGEPPACPKPTQLAVNYESGTTAEVTWEGTATSYNIDVNGTVTNNVTSPYTLSGLELATEYAVMVQANCGSEQSEWATTRFTTDACMPEDMIVINYELEDSYGDGWNDNYILVVDGDCNVVEALTITSGTSASGTLKICSQYVSFMWYAGSYPTETSWTFTDANGNELFSGTGTASMQTYDVLYLYDNESVKRPSDLVVHEDAIGPYGAKLSWTENGTATAWQIGVYDETETTLINTVDANSNPFMLTGLQAETTYSVKVRSVTSAGQSAWTCPGVGFTTGVGCGAPAALDVTPYPISAIVDWASFEEGYDIEWTEISAAKDGGLWLQYDNNTFATGIGSTTSGVRTWGVMYPAAMLEGNKNLTKVSVYEYATYYTCDSYTINIYQGIDQPVTLIGTETVVPSGEDGMHEITLTAPITLDLTQNLWITMTVEGTYVMMACQSNEPNNQWWDNNADGVWTNMGDDNSNLAGYGWMIRGYVEGYNPADFNWTSETGILPPYTIEDLSPETTYFVKVKASCGTEWIWAQFTTPSACDAPVNLEATDLAYNAATLNWIGYQDSYNVQYREAAKYVTVWEDDFENGISDEWTIIAGIGAETVGTNEAWYTIDPTSGLSLESHSGTYCASSWSWNSDAYQANNWLITPRLEFQGVLKYYVRTNASYPDHYEVLLSTTTADTTSFTVTLKDMAVAPTNGEWNEVIIDLSAYADQQGYIAIHHVDYDANYLLIDDFGIYNVEAATAWIPATTTEPTLAITGLTKETEYEWQVQGVNAGCTGGLTEWSEMATFTTPGYPINTIALVEGWNYFSTNVDITLADLQNALVEALPGATSIKIQAKNQSSTYNGASWRGTLRTLDAKQMYKIQTPSACTIELTGEPLDPAELDIQVLGGGQYTYIGFPLNESMTVTNAFAGFATNGDKILSKDGNASYTGRWRGTLSTLEPGVGYIYQSAASATNRTLVYPSGTSKTTRIVAGPAIEKQPRTTEMY